MNTENRTPGGTVDLSTATAPSAASLLRRATLFLEDGDFKSAAEYLDRVLDIDPECAEAYALKTCAALGVRREADLGEMTRLFSDNADWQKALRFADAEQRARFEGYMEAVRARADQSAADGASGASKALLGNRRGIIVAVVAVALMVAVFFVVKSAIKPKIHAGDYVAFGRYEQDNDLSNGAEPIEWLVLDVQDGKALLISRYGLDAKPYNEEEVGVTWETCTLRGWLNGAFMDAAFTYDEKNAILLTDVDNSDSQGYSGWNTTGGNDTQDQIFLLSYAEANRYFDVTWENRDNTRSRAAPTAYAVAQGAGIFTFLNAKTADGDAPGWWWLRSPGRNQNYNYATLVYDDGSLTYSKVNDYIPSVRPAMWVNLDSGVF